MKTQNDWQLYSSMAGCAAVNRRLNAAYARVEKKMLAQIKKRPIEIKAIVNAAQEKMRALMKQYTEFGASDSETDGYLANLLQSSVRKNGFPCAVVDRFDGFDLND